MKPYLTRLLHHASLWQLSLVVLSLLFAWAPHAALAAAGDIVTIAGGGAAEGEPATSVGFSFDQIAYDSYGNLYIADCNSDLVRKVDASGIMTTVAGVGSPGFFGDGGPAKEAALRCPSGVAADASGNLYISDSSNQRIRKVDPVGIITTVAGTGTAGFSGDGGAATSAQLYSPSGLAIDGSGALFVADYNNRRVRKIDSTGIITTVAGNGSTGSAGDGGQATLANLYSPNAVAVDASGKLYIADVNNQKIRVVDTQGIIMPFAGTGTYGFSGDNGPATSAQLHFPNGVWVDGAGNVLIADSGNHRVRKVNPAGIITTIAGTGVSGYSNDGAAATTAQLNYPYSVTADAAGNPVIGDTYNLRIRKIDSSGVIDTIAGNGMAPSFGEGVPGTSAQLITPVGLALDASGNLYVGDNSNNRVRRVSASGVITSYAGVGVRGFAGDGGPATDARLSYPYGIATAGGNVYVADNFNNRIRKIDASGTISTAAGNGSYGFSGDYGPATAAALNRAYDVALDAAGNLYIADTENHRIRKVSTSGTITTVAGTGTAGYSGDGGAAQAAMLNGPFAVALDGVGNLFVCDRGNHRIRKIDQSGNISMVAGNGSAGFAGDGGAAASASLNMPAGIALDAAGNLYIADSHNHRVRKVDTAGMITTVAGNGAQSFSGDHVPATSASLYYPQDVVVDAAGNILIADTSNSRVRMVLATVQPSGSIAINQGAPLTNAASVSLALSCTSQAGACTEMQLSDDGAAWLPAEPYSSVKAWNLLSGDGARQVFVKFRDEAGTWSMVYSDSILVDTTPPAIGISSPQGLVPSVTPLLAYSLSEGTAMVTVKVDGVAVGTVSGSYLDTLSEGTHALRVEATDPAGNFAFAEAEFTVALPPTVTIVSPVAGATTDITPLLSYVASRGAVTVTVDGAVVAAPSGIELQALPDGAHVIRVAAVDAAGLVGAAEVSIVVDTVGPVVLPLEPLSRLAAGGDFSIAIGADGALWTWGRNQYGQLGDDSTSIRVWPHVINGDPVWRSVAAGHFHGAALREDGTLWSWGYNTNGALGDGTVTNRLSAVRVGADSDWRLAAAGRLHTAAIKTDGTLWTWGSNYWGQLGNGTWYDRHDPHNPFADTNWVSVDAGFAHTVALKSDGTMWLWGFNYYGQVGDGSFVDRALPVQVGDNQWRNISSGDYHNLALKADGTLWSWGYNFNGQLGNGSTQNSNIPVRVGYDNDWVAVSAGSTHNLALKRNGTLWSWGSGGSGAMGTGTNYSSTSPVQVGADTDWVAIETGVWHSFAVKGDGSLWGFGSNEYGGLGDGTTVDRYVPTRIGVDLALPAIRIDNGAPYTADTLVRLGLFARDAVGVAQMQFSEDGGSWSEPEPYATSRTWTLQPGDGLKHVSVRFKDNVGNWSSAISASITLDTVAPAVSITSPVDGSVTPGYPLLSYSVSDGAVVVKVDGAVVNKISGSTLDALAEGSHTVRVESTDAVGKVGFAEVQFTVDLPPTVTITSPATGPTNNNSPLLAYTVSNGTVAVKVDGNVVNLVSGDSLGLFTDGAHTVRVEATDASGTGFAERSFVVDTVAPVVSITSPTTGATQESQPLLIYSMSDGTATVKVDGISVATASGSRLSTLSNGTHVVRIEARDAAGNVGAAEISFTVNASTTTEGFETGDLSALPWVMSGDGPWVVTTAVKHGGQYAVKAATITHSQSSAMEASVNCAAGNISFWYSLSSESNYDFLTFYVDGVQKGRWSGSVAWTQLTVPVTAGAHTLKWVYSKDGSVSTGSDTAWVDDIVFPLEVPAPPSNTVSEGFEAGNFSAFPWVQTGNQAWLLTTSPTHGGGYAARAGYIADFQSSAMETTVNCAEGSMSFWYSVSSEGNYDFLTFYVDGVQKGRWSGSVSWMQLAVPVTAGTHTFRWVYSKDGSASTGSDTAWIDDIVFPVPLIVPTVTIFSPATGITSNRTPLLSYVVSEGSLVVKVDGVVVDKASGAPLDPLADGPHVVRIEATNGAGTGFAEVPFHVDTVQPVVGIDAVVTPTSNSSQSIGGTRESNASIGAAINTAATIGAIQYPTATTWSCSVSNLAEGGNTITVTATDAAGNSATASTSITVDTMAPVVTLTAPAAGLTGSRTPVLTYSVSEGTSIVKVDGVVVTKASGDTLGPLADGEHTVRIEATDAAGNAAFAEVTFTVDATAPTVTITSPTTGLGNNRTPVLLFSVSDGTVVVRVDGVVTPLLSGDTLAALADGTHSVRVEATDVTGNVAFAEVSFTVDATTPGVAITSPAAGPTGSNTPALAYSADDGTVVVKVDGVIVNKASGQNLDALVDGLHAVKVESTDAAGNTGFAEVTFTVDTAAPVVALTAPASGASNDSTPQLMYSVSDGTVVVKVDGVTVSKVSGDMLASLADGPHVVRVESTDAAGNLGSAEVSFTVDTAAPSVVIAAPAAGLTNNSTPALAYTVSDGNVIVKVDGAIVSKLSGDLLDTLADGTHTVRVASVDAAGNAAYAETSFTVDATAPTVAITSPSAGLGNNRTPVLTYSVSDGTIVVQVDGAVLPLLSGATLGPLADGVHTIRVQSTDAAGNMAFAEVSFSVDATAPAVTITSPAAGLTGDSTPVLTYSAGDGTVVVTVDGVVVSKVSGNTLAALADGPHVVRVESTDASGNLGSAEVSFTVDTAAPSVVIASPAAGLTNNSTPALAYTVSDGSVTVKVDGAVVSKLSGDLLDTLAEGAHTVRVESVDAAGNLNFAEVTFTVDTMAPMVTLTAPAAGLTGSRTPVLTYSVSEGTPAVKVDGVVVTNASGDTLGPLADGEHTVRIEATDAAGNAAFAEVTFTVDATAPTVTITSPTTGLGNNRTPVLLFSVSDGTVVVRVDGVVTPLLSGDTLAALADGTHSVRVEATDVTGNVAFAEVSFTVDATTPGVAITSPATGPTGSNTPVLAYSADDGTVVVKVDGVIVNKASGQNLDALADGLHAVKVESTDAAGNTGFAEITFTVDTTAPVVGITSPASGASSDSTPQLAYSVSDGTVVVKVDGVTVSKVSGDTLAALADGPHGVRVESTDAAGNLGSAEVSFTVDTAAPSVVIASPAAGLTNNSTPALAYTVSDGNVIVKVDGAIVSKLSGDLLDTLADGTHTVRVASVDAAGNAAYAETSFTVDATAPVVAITSPSAGITGNNTPVLIYDAGDGAVVVKVDGVPVGKVSGDSLAALTDGLHVVRVESTDAAGNLSSAEVSFTVDTTAPVVGITSPATGFSNNTNPQLIYTVSDGTAVVKVDGVTVSKTSGQLLDTLADGSHTVRVESADAAGNTSFAEVVFDIDATAPPVSIASPIAGTTPDNTPLLIFSAGDGSAVVKVDGVAVGKVSGMSLDTLGNGTHTVTVASTDAAGNIGTASVAFTVSYSPLAVATVSLPWGTTGVSYGQSLIASGGVPGYTWSVTGGNLPGGLSLNTSTGAITGAPTATGTFSFTVQAADSDGASVARSLTVVIYAPVEIGTASLAAGYAGAAYSQSLAATGGLAPYNWSIVSGSLPQGLTLNAATGEISGTPTAAENSTFTVQGSDANQSAATRSFTITVNPSRPDLAVSALSGPATGTRGKKISVTATVTNQGQATAAASTLTLYLSSDGAISTGDIRLADVTINSLAPGASQSITVNATIPSGTAVGSYYVGALADRSGAVVETNEANNAMTGNVIQVR